MLNTSKARKTTSLEDIYSEIESESIDFDDVKFIECKSLSMQDDGGECYIAINGKHIHTQAELKVILAHELGHCKTGSFYNRYSKFDLVCQHEYRADRQAVLDLVPYEDLMEALQDGITEVWELAERFDVTEDFIRTVFKHYEAMGKTFR